MINSLNLKIGNDTASALKDAQIEFEELVTLLCIYTNNRRILISYLEEKSPLQKVVYFQRFLRKQLLTTEKNFETLENDFNVDYYFLTEYAINLCATFANNFLTNLPETHSQDVILSPIKSITNVADIEKEKFNKFLNDYLSKFPPGIRNNGGKLIRVSPEDAEKKMAQFISKYKRYGDYDLILKATENYIKRLSGKYDYCPTAEYFIIKNGTSALASECETILNRTSQFPQDLSSPFDKIM